MKKGSLEYIILLLISKKQLYVSEIITTLQKHNLLVVEGTLYPLLSRLKKQGLLKYIWVEAEKGHPRKYYQLSEKGEETLLIMQKARTTLSDSIQSIEKI